MSQALDLLEGIHERHVRGDRRFHQVDLVQVLGGDRLLQDLLRQEPEDPDDGEHGGPARGAEDLDGTDDDRRRAEREQVGHHLVPQDQQAFFALQLVADEEGEIEERAGEEEVDTGQRERRGQEIESDPGRPTEPPDQREDAERRQERDVLAAGIDQTRTHRLPQPDRVHQVHAGRHPCNDLRRHRHEDADQDRHAKLREVGVLAEPHRGRAKRRHRQQDEERRDRMLEPAEIQQERERRQRQPDPDQRLGVERQDPGRIKQRGHRR